MTISCTPINHSPDCEYAFRSIPEASTEYLLNIDEPGEDDRLSSKQQRPRPTPPWHIRATSIARRHQIEAQVRYQHGSAKGRCWMAYGKNRWDSGLRDTDLGTSLWNQRESGPEDCVILTFDQQRVMDSHPGTDDGEDRGSACSWPLVFVDHECSLTPTNTEQHMRLASAA